MADRGLVTKVVVGLVVLGAVVGGAAFFLTGGDFQYRTPTVESIESEFGDVSREEAEIRTRVVVQNPNNRSLPGAASVRYDVTLNGIEVAAGSRGGVGLETGENTIDINGTFDNSQVPSWWVSHVNSGERSRLNVTPAVSVTGLPIDTELPPRTSTIETDLLGPMERENESTVVLAEREILVVSNRTAAWGEADAERTPVDFSVDLRNVHDRPVRLDGTEYRIEMNGVVVGEGTTDDGIVLQPGESGTFTANAALNSSKMQAWWVTHLRNGQTTDLTVEVYGVVEDDGERKRVPLNVFDSRLRFETDVLGEGESTVTPVPSNATEATFSQPEVLDTESRWGEVREAETDIVTEVTVDNPNGGEYSDLLELTVDQRTTINGVEVAENTSTVERLPTGRGTFTLVAAKDHSTVPRWWARHVNGGERSRVRTNVTGTADVGVTTLPVDLPDRNSTIETDVVGTLESDEDRPVEQNGRTVLTITRTRAEWGEATPEDGPIEMRVTVRNEQLATATIRDVNYTVALNDVKLADERELDRTFEIPPGATRTIEFTIHLDNSKMADWWPTHVRNDETSQLRSSAHATVEVGTETERTELNVLGDDATIETDILAEDSESGSG